MVPPDSVAGPALGDPLSAEVGLLCVLAAPVLGAVVAAAVPLAVYPFELRQAGHRRRYLLMGTNFKMTILTVTSTR